MKKVINKVIIGKIKYNNLFLILISKIKIKNIFIENSPNKINKNYN
jgi:hypothetical protein